MCVQTFCLLELPVVHNLACQKVGHWNHNKLLTYTQQHKKWPQK